MSKYDRKTCVTARELRKVGIPLPAIVPEVSWVPRDSIKVINSDGVHFSECKFGERFGSFSMEVHITFTEPFRWDDERYDPEHT